ncbi:UNVERIFIED_CONTAM: hypothetical protein K2H54_000188 [Gekko kuhli]
MKSSHDDTKSPTVQPSSKGNYHSVRVTVTAQSKEHIEAMYTALGNIELVRYVLQLGRRPYQPVWDAMKAFTDSRTSDTPDEFWVVEHDPVYTQGQAGKAEHLLAPGDIPVLVLYVLVDVRRSKLTVRELVTCLETAIINTLAKSGIEAYAKPDAPGVYVKNQLGASLQTEAKLASLGLRIRKGCSFHGLALNVNMDMTPFLRINPCGYAGMAMTQTSALGGPQSVAEAQAMLVAETGQPDRL